MKYVQLKVILDDGKFPTYLNGERVNIVAVTPYMDRTYTLRYFDTKKGSYTNVNNISFDDNIENLGFNISPNVVNENVFPNKESISLEEQVEALKIELHETRRILAEFIDTYRLQTYGYNVSLEKVGLNVYVDSLKGNDPNKKHI